MDIFETALEEWNIDLEVKKETNDLISLNLSFLIFFLRWY